MWNLLHTNLNGDVRLKHSLSAPVVAWTITALPKTSRDPCIPVVWKFTASILVPFHVRLNRSELSNRGKTSTCIKFSSKPNKHHTIESTFPYPFVFVTENGIKQSSRSGHFTLLGRARSPNIGWSRHQKRKGIIQYN